MPKSDEPLGPSFERQLRSALDHVEPPATSPRYLAGQARPWRFAPLALGAGVAGVVALTALTAFAATGTVSPAVVMNRISTAIQPEPESTPAPAPSEIPKAAEPEHQATSEPKETEAPKPTETPKPEPAETPKPSERPEPSPEPGGGEPGESG